MSTYRYTVLNLVDHDFEDAIVWNNDLEKKADKTGAALYADDMAEDYYDSHEGWDDHWPLIFRIWDDATGELFGDIEIELEHRPSFYCYGFIEKEEEEK